MIFGVAGDALTFVGSVLLAWDALRREARVQSEQRQEGAVSELPPAVPIFVQSVRLSRDGLKRLLARAEAARAKLGAIVLCLGFACLLTSRVLEIKAEKKHLPVPACTSRPPVR
jgi:hypothetical protein